jgi:hypothetical protein
MRFSPFVLPGNYGPESVEKEKPSRPAGSEGSTLSDTTVLLFIVVRL